MDRWTPLWSRIVDSSIWSEPDSVCKIFITMLACKDMDHVVRMNAYNISVRARKTEKEVLDALKILSSPDKKRLEPQPFEGRRIRKVEDGWLILNGEMYRKMMTKINRDEYKARWQRENRKNKKGGSKTQAEHVIEDLRERGMEEEAQHVEDVSEALASTPLAVETPEVESQAAAGAEVSPADVSAPGEI
jgi:hypothetical protein